MSQNLLIAQHAHAWHTQLQAGVHSEAPLLLPPTGEMDLAGVQLLLAWSRARALAGLTCVAAPLPAYVCEALRLAGCLDEADELDTTLIA